MRGALTLAVLAAAQAQQCAPILPAIGCYNDQAGPRVVNFEASGPSLSMTLEQCATTCYAAGFGLIGLTGNAAAGGYCYCGQVPDPAAVPAPTSSCNLPCPGATNETCGGNYRMSLYNTTCFGPGPMPPGPACSQPQAQAFPFCNT